VDPKDILDFWLGPLDIHGLSSQTQASRWWKRSDAFDEEIATRFRGTYDLLVEGQLDGWLRSSTGTLAYVIVIDQLSRNLFRGDSRAWAQDEHAQRVVEHALDDKVDHALVGHARAFLYMPLMHAENIDMQDRCVGLFTQMLDESVGARKSRLRGHLEAAVDHRGVIARFGRFPHRNQVLGRKSTGAELDYLREHPGW
jgi:uncharacterized protein (DUF924 family)